MTPRPETFSLTYRFLGDRVRSYGDYKWTGIASRVTGSK
jgi:hypothetical protein